ncbi:MAG: hypothetical protein EAZ91_17895 [Cytophagales bacterium]|nr:MAG: hypothetical protein EAZ91_17895 [Cytophagales bacterium]
MNFLNLLHQQTQQLQGQIRSLICPKEDSVQQRTLPLKRYQQLLYANLAYHRALETALTHQAPYLPGYDQLLQCRTPYLVADLLATGAPIPQDYPAYFESWSSWQLMGAVYIGEGLATEATEVCEALKQNPLVPPMARISRFFSAPSATHSLATYVTNRAEGHEDEVIRGVQQAIELYSDLTDPSDRDPSDRDASDRPTQSLH